MLKVHSQLRLTSSHSITQFHLHRLMIHGTSAHNASYIHNIKFHTFNCCMHSIFLKSLTHTPPLFFYGFDQVDFFFSPRIVFFARHIHSSSHFLSKSQYKCLYIYRFRLVAALKYTHTHNTHLMLANILYKTLTWFSSACSLFGVRPSLSHRCHFCHPLSFAIVAQSFPMILLLKLIFVKYVGSDGCIRWTMFHSIAIK